MSPLVVRPPNRAAVAGVYRPVEDCQTVGIEVVVEPLG